MLYLFQCVWLPAGRTWYRHMGTRCVLLCVCVWVSASCNLSSRSCFPGLRWGKAALAAGPFHLRHWGPKQRENDWLDDELFRGGEPRNEPAMLGREERKPGERRRHASLPLPLARPWQKTRSAGKKLAPNCTNACHGKFAKIKYWCGRADKAGGSWSGRRGVCSGMYGTCEDMHTEDGGETALTDYLHALIGHREKMTISP